MEHEELLKAARTAAGYASAPFSQFPVGAAVEAEDGRLFPGCNIESPAYPMTLCAERVAIFSCIASGGKPRRIAVTCLKGNPRDPDSLMPCGACRQVILDQMGHEA